MEKRFIEFLNKSHTTYQAITEAKKILLDNNFIELDLINPWNLKKGQNYFIIKNDASIIAFKLGKTLNKQAYYSIDDVDIVLLVVDGSSELGGGDKYVIEKLKDVNKPVILVINKIDKLTKEGIYNKINEIHESPLTAPLWGIRCYSCCPLFEN